MFQKFSIYSLSLLTLTLIFSLSSRADNLPLFSTWDKKNFLGQNTYLFSHDNSQNIVRMESDKSASGLFLKKTIDLNKTPMLNWSWKISNVYEALNERSKKGDDYPVRVYVLASTGPLPWQKHTLTYVWSNYQKVGTIWPSPYTQKVVMIALNSGSKRANQWQQHQRNVQQDLEAAFGKIYAEIEVIAIMTDTDNSGQKATAWYRNLTFSAVK